MHRAWIHLTPEQTLVAEESVREIAGAPEGGGLRALTTAWLNLPTTRSRVSVSNLNVYGSAPWKGGSDGWIADLDPRGSSHMLYDHQVVCLLMLDAHVALASAEPRSMMARLSDSDRNSPGLDTRATTASLTRQHLHGRERGAEVPPRADWRTTLQTATLASFNLGSHGSAFHQQF